MNIFFTDYDPVFAARNLSDKHCVKMVLETAQLLCSPHGPGVAPYKRTHYNHPCAIWARTSVNNYCWLLQHAYSLCEEYTIRYGKTHKSQQVVDWCAANMNKIVFTSDLFTEPPQCMPEKYKSKSVIGAYRKYYIGEKLSFAKWKTKVPVWIENRN